MWNRRADEKQTRKSAASRFTEDKEVPADQIKPFLESILRPGDRVCLEGNNQKHADFLAKALTAVDPGRVHGLHLLLSTVGLPEHLDLFERGIAERLDFAYSGPQGARLATMVANQQVTLGAIHTYLELYSRLFLELCPNVCLVCANAADAHGNLYTGPNTEDTPVLVEASAFHNGIVVAQVNERTDSLPRVDIPGGWVDYFVVSPQPYQMEALFTRDPAKLDETHVLMAMLAMKGIYAEYGVESLNHGIGYATAAIELLLPTYGAELGFKGRLCKHWALNPHPTMIPAIESGFVESMVSFGSELGMADYVAARPDVFFTGPDGSLRSNRCYSQMAGLYGIDLFIGATLQIDIHGNSSTATHGRITGFGGAPNLGGQPAGRRHDSPAWRKAGQERRGSDRARPGRGRKLVVQMARTFGKPGSPSFVESLDAMDPSLAAATSGTPPIMLYGEDVTHIVSEKGIAYLLRCAGEEERIAAIRGIAGDTPVGAQQNSAETMRLRRCGILQTPEDLGIDVSTATVDRLAARSIADLVTWSSGLYQPPERFAE